MKSRFRHPEAEVGKRYLAGLFWEKTLADKSTCLYTLKEWDHEGFPSLYRLYIECDDPTEYTFAKQYMESWDHWETLCQCNWFKPIVALWRKELDLKTKAKALAAIKATANDPNSKESYQANKFLATYSDNQTKRKGAGRPSKSEVQTAAKEMARETTALNDDLARVTGTVQ